MNRTAVFAAAAAGAALVAGLALMPGDPEAPAGNAATPAAQAAGTATAQVRAPTTAQAPGMGSTPAAVQPVRAAPSPAAPAAAALSPAAQAALQQFERLRGLPAGDASIALSRQLEAGITADNAEGYVHALLTAASPTEVRAAGAALSRVGDSTLMRRMAGLYGSLEPEQRGRVLQVLEQASNPEAIEGLAALFTADTSEKRSALVVSALYGVANIGTMESVQVLLKQVTPANADYALLALDRVNSTQGIEMIRAAANGSKDAQSIPAHFLPALKRIAQGKS